eukprot:COSAG02_NODE_925_length_15858_cov_4.267276_11_plen_375_part_00
MYPSSKMWMVAKAFVWLTTTAGVANAGLQNDTSPTTVTPTLLFGPTANLKAPLLSSLVNGLVASPQGLKQWHGLRSKMEASPGGGALHLRQMAFADLSPTESTTLARVSRSIGLPISIEGGGALCGAGTGVSTAERTLTKTLGPFLTAGGTVSHFMLESIFSRTTAACRNQTHAETAEQVAAFAGRLKSTLGNETAFYLYDALPHYRVGDKWPANKPSHYDMELGTVLSQLITAMNAKGVKLTGYWADSPMEYSANFPCVSPVPTPQCTPGPAGSGYKKLAAAVKLVKDLDLKVGKTFNSQVGGKSSAEAFHKGTMVDWEGAARTVPSAISGNHGWDAIMVETWYPYPTKAIPETTPYTTAFTALTVFEQAESQ